jgi:hypothetical protein
MISSKTFCRHFADSELVGKNEARERSVAPRENSCPCFGIYAVFIPKNTPRSQIRAALPLSSYRAQWFDPRLGTWRDTENGNVESSSTGIIQLPDFLDDRDWGLRLEYSHRKSEK